MEFTVNNGSSSHRIPVNQYVKHRKKRLINHDLRDRIKNVNKALNDESWVKAMQEGLIGSRKIMNSIW